MGSLSIAHNRNGSMSLAQWSPHMGKTVPVGYFVEVVGTDESEV